MIYVLVYVSEGKQVQNLVMFSSNSLLLNELRLVEAARHLAERFALHCKGRLVRGLNTKSLVDYLGMLVTVAEIQAQNRLPSAMYHLKRRHYPLLKDKLTELITALAPIQELTLIQESEISIILDQMAPSIARHLLGVNPYVDYWNSVLSN